MLLIIWAQLCTVIPLVIYFFLTTAFMYVTMSISTSSAYICMYVLNISMVEDEHYKRALLLYRGAGNLPNPNDRPIVTQSKSHHDHHYNHNLHLTPPYSDPCKLFATWFSLTKVDFFFGFVFYIVKTFKQWIKLHQRKQSSSERKIYVGCFAVNACTHSFWQKRSTAALKGFNVNFRIITTTVIINSRQYLSLLRELLGVHSIFHCSASNDDSYAPAPSLIVTL